MGVIQHSEIFLLALQNKTQMNTIGKNVMTIVLGFVLQNNGYAMDCALTNQSLVTGFALKQVHIYLKIIWLDLSKKLL